MKLLLPLAALLGCAVWLTLRRRAVPDLPQVAKLKAVRKLEVQITEDARRRIALCAERRRVS